MADNVYRFRLEGMDHVLRGDKTPAQMADIVRSLESKLDVIHQVAPGYSSIRAVTLAALQLAEELQEARQEYNDLLEAADIGGGKYDNLFSRTSRNDA